MCSWQNHKKCYTGGASYRGGEARAGAQAALLSGKYFCLFICLVARAASLSGKHFCLPKFDKIISLVHPTKILSGKNFCLPALALKSSPDLIRWSQECLFVAGSDPGGAETLLCHSSDNSTQVSHTISRLPCYVVVELGNQLTHHQSGSNQIHRFVIIIIIIALTVWSLIIDHYYEHHPPSEWLWFFVIYNTASLNKCKSLINLPDRVTKDVALEGYHIPKDSLALANLTGFMQVFGHCQKKLFFLFSVSCFVLGPCFVVSPVSRHPFSHF